MRATTLKERRWEVMEIGESFGPIEVAITDAMVKAFVFAVDDFDRRYLEPGAHGAQLAPPTMLCRDARDVIRTAYDLASGGAGMHTKHACEIHRCPVVGERVRVTGRHVDKFLKRDRQTIVLASEVLGEDGAPIMTQRSTHIRALKPGVAKAAPPPSSPELPGAGDVVVDRGGLRPGAWLSPLAKSATREQLVAFAGMEWPNIHTDESIARAAGLRGCIASGLQTMAYVSQMMSTCLADGWRTGGRLDVAFTAPLHADETVYVCARVAAIDADDAGRRVSFDVWCDTRAGVRVLAGKASGHLLT